MAANASRFTTQYTAAQKTAILRAVLADGHTVAEARKMARAGQLDVPAFEIGTYAYTLVRDGRAAFEAQDETALDRAVADELKGAELDILAELRAIRRRGKTQTIDTTALAKTTRDLAQVRKARRDTQTAGSNQRAKAKPAAYTPGTEPVNTPESANVVASLLEKTREGGRGGSLADARSDVVSTSAA